MRNLEEWTKKVIIQAEIIDMQYPIKGTAVWLPYGFQIRKHAIEIIRKLLDSTHQEVLFPALVPKSQLLKEVVYVENYEDEVFWVTKYGKNELDEPLALRPTSETIMYPMFSLWIRTHADLPLRYYQVVNAFRYEMKKTQSLMRVHEITTFKEAHTVHATKEESDMQVLDFIEIYKEFFDKLGIPYMISRRPEWDKFPSADCTITFDAIMPDGKALQIATINNLAQSLAELFDVTFEDADGKQKYAYQTCAGISERVLGSLIAVHGDDDGLRLPPMVAPFQVIILPNLSDNQKEEALNKCVQIKNQLESSKIRVKIDDRDMSITERTDEWIVKGAPIMLNIASDDLKNNVAQAFRRDILENFEVHLNESLTEVICSLLEEYGKNLAKSALYFQKDHIKIANGIDEISELIEKGNVVRFSWKGDESVAKKIVKDLGYDILDIHKIRIDENTIEYSVLVAETY